MFPRYNQKQWHQEPKPMTTWVIFNLLLPGLNSRFKALGRGRGPSVDMGPWLWQEKQPCVFGRQRFQSPTWNPQRLPLDTQETGGTEAGQARNSWTKAPKCGVQKGPSIPLHLSSPLQALIRLGLEHFSAHLLPPLYLVEYSPPLPSCQASSPSFQVNWDRPGSFLSQLMQDSAWQKVLPAGEPILLPCSFLPHNHVLPLGQPTRQDCSLFSGTVLHIFEHSYSCHSCSLARSFPSLSHRILVIYN